MSTLLHTSHVLLPIPWFLVYNLHIYIYMLNLPRYDVGCDMCWCNMYITSRYTLVGHEHVVSEEFDKALTAYRQAISLDPRHYNAWYGLGSIFYRQEKFELSTYHFRRAIGINPSSSVLYCYLGMALHANRASQEVYIYIYTNKYNHPLFITIITFFYDLVHT